ncbi:MAG: lysophospholipid acyltransferase family protein [Opitutaceae bacterium]|nr:lysophospholipid acyltransferase family protein [Cytophagales bacterium]
MIYPKHSKLYKLFFDFYTSIIIKSDFKSFHIETEYEENYSEKPLLVIANHFSWWDGFLHYHLNNVHFKKKYHVMMLEEQLQKRMFLTRLGIFSVKKGSRDALKSLEFANQLLKQCENMLLIFPQGKIESQHKHVFQFEGGIEKLVANNPTIKVVFAVSLIDYFSERKPEARFYLKTISLRSGKTIQEEFNNFYKESLEKQYLLAN